MSCKHSIYFCNRFVHRSTALSEWEQNSRCNKERAEAEIKASIDLRGAVALSIAQVNCFLGPESVVPCCVGEWQPHLCICLGAAAFVV